MKHRTVHIRGWRVDVFIDDGKYYVDMRKLNEVLDEMGAPYEITEKADSLVTEDVPNQAFTYSRGRRTCIYIGRTTSPEEFINSMIHEIRHLVDHIAEYYGISNGEAVGYMSGDAAFLLAEDICEHGCPHCKTEKETT